jgi:hypothetical protein
LSCHTVCRNVNIYLGLFYFRIFFFDLFHVTLQNVRERMGAQAVYYGRLRDNDDAAFEAHGSPGHELPLALAWICASTHAQHRPGQKALKCNELLDI